VGKDGPVVSEYGIDGYPTYLVIDGNGVVRARSYYFGRELMDLISDLVARVEALDAQ